MGIDDPVPGVSLEAFNDALRDNGTPCPKCRAVGTLTMAWKFVPSTLGTYSLAGVQPKVSARRLLVATCSACGVKARVDPVRVEDVPG